MYLLCNDDDDLRAIILTGAGPAFYASTPSYRAAFEHHGLGNLASELQQLSRVQRWEEMPSLISDEVLHIYATVGTYGEIVDRLYERYGRIITNAESSIPVRRGEERERLADLVRELQSKPASEAIETGG